MNNRPELEKCAVILLWFCGFALVGTGIIVWLVCLVTRTPKVVEEYSIQKLDPPIDWSERTNVYYPSDGFTIITNRQPERWFSFTYTDNNWHWTNVVFSSTREPVVTKTNGEWRITFK